MSLPPSPFPPPAPPAPPTKTDSLDVTISAEAVYILMAMFIGLHVLVCVLIHCAQKYQCCWRRRRISILCLTPLLLVLLFLHGALPFMWTLPLSSFVRLWHLPRERYAGLQRTCMHLLMFVAVLCVILAQPAPVTPYRDGTGHQRVILYRTSTQTTIITWSVTLLLVAVSIPLTCKLQSRCRRRITWIIYVQTSVGALLLRFAWHRVIPMVCMFAFSTTTATTTTTTKNPYVKWEPMLVVITAVIGGICVITCRRYLSGEHEHKLSYASLTTRILFGVFLIATLNRTLTQLERTQFIATVATWIAANLVLLCAAHAEHTDHVQNYSYFPSMYENENDNINENENESAREDEDEDFIASLWTTSPSLHSSP